MSYGALLNLNNGNPFVTPNSTPFVLYTKVNVSSSANGVFQSSSTNISISSSYPAIAFLKTTYTEQPTIVGSRRDGDSIVVSSSNPFGQSHTLTAYVFARFPQPLPKYGMAIWDEGGTCILTNESKVLTDLVTIGTPGVNGGINIDETLSGSYAVSPGILGSTLIRFFVQGQPQVISVTAYTGARFNGLTTRISAASSGNATGDVVGYTNNGNAITAIKTDIYD